MNKEDLCPGRIVELRQGDLGVVMDNKILFSEFYMEIGTIQKDLTYTGTDVEHSLDIVAIYVPSSICLTLTQLLDKDRLNLIWKRPAKVDWELIPRRTKVLVKDTDKTDWIEAEFIAYLPGNTYPFMVYNLVDDSFATSFIQCKLKEEM